VDYHRRQLEWFAHYLKGEPAADWITHGESYLARQRMLKAYNAAQDGPRATGCASRNVRGWRVARRPAPLEPIIVRRRVPPGASHTDGAGLASPRAGGPRFAAATRRAVRRRSRKRRRTDSVIPSAAMLCRIVSSE